MARGRAANASVALLAAIALVGHRWTAVPAAESARILAVETAAARSHWNFMSAVLRSLTVAGHEVTVFTPFPDDDDDDDDDDGRANYTAVDTSAQYQTLLDADLSLLVARYRGPVAFMRAFPALSRRNCDVIMRHPRFDAILRNRNAGPAPFDLIVMEPQFTDCMSHVAHTLDLPIAFVIPSAMTTHAERDHTGHVSHPACVSHLLAGHGMPQTFVHRFTNTLMLAYTVVMREYGNRMLRVTDPRPYDLSPVVRPSVIFQNSFHGTEAPRPVLPNIVDVGGIHLKPAQKIPTDILKFIEESSHGIIYFTFGSTVKFSSLPNHIVKSFKEALAQVPQKVLWKYEEEMEDLPKNVMIRKWFPQRDILLHPKVKLFISHSGMSGVYEALDAGVPVLGFPLIYDQPRNIDNLVNAEMAISMDLFTVSKDTLLDNILELVNNEKYTKNAKIASDRFRDRPISPQKLVVYWIEYVIRHKGAPHLKYHGYNLTWYQYFLLDVIATVSFILFVTYKVFKFIFNCILKFSTNKKVKIQ